MNECIFCKIVNKEIPALVLYEDEKTLAFLDVNPRFEGHTIVIPRTHAEKLTDLSDEEVMHLFKVVKHISKHLEEVFDTDSFNIGSNNGESAGQVVKHLHIHIFPRPKDSEKKYGFEAAFPVNEEAKNKLQETLSKIGNIEPLSFSSEKPKPKPQPKKEEKPKDDWYFDEEIY